MKKASSHSSCVERTRVPTAAAAGPVAGTPGDDNPAAPQPRACHFGPPGLPMSGWYHPAAGPAGGVAVLICAPIGDEGIAVHRGLWRLAGELATQGMATLRFDPWGTGDSADPPDLADGDQVAVWLESIRVAAAALRAASGVRAIALLGVRHGGLLAAHAAAAVGDVAALVALLPVPDGRGYLRECRLLQASLGQGAPSGGSTLAGGHRYNRATAQRLESLDWRLGGAPGDPPGHPALPRALVIDRADRPVGKACAERLRQAGTEVVHEMHAGLDRLTTMAHQSLLPASAARRMVGWLAALDERQQPLAAAPDLSVLRAGPEPWSTAGGELIEEHLGLGTRPRLAGLLTRRSLPVPAGARGVLMLSSGSERLIGAHRIYTVYARERAARGDVVLRIDRAGIGDSEARPGAPDNEPFDPAAVADVRAAVAFLRATHGVAACSIVGVCAGAYHAWRAVVEGLDVDSLVSVNAVAYSASDSKDIDPRVAALQVALLAKARRSLVDWQQWQQLLRGELRLRGIAVAAVGRVRAAWAKAVRQAARLAGRPMVDDLAVDLVTVARRGIRQHFIFSPREPGWVLLRSQGGGALGRLLRRGLVRVEQLADADHSCTSPESQEALRSALHAALDADAGSPPMER